MSKKTSPEKAEIERLIFKVWGGCDALLATQMNAEAQIMYWKRARRARDKAIEMLAKF